MASERSITPEKQLLRLIEEDKAKNATALQAYALKRHSLSFVSLGAWLARFSFSQDWLKKRVESFKGQPLDIKLINKVLLLCISAFTIYFSVSTTNAFIHLRRLPSLEIQTPESAGSINLTERTFLKKAVSSYLEKIGERDIFQMGVIRETMGPDGVQTSVKVTSSKILDATENLKLVGISWSSEPDAIIENTKDMKTFFVKTGQRIGEVKVQAIFKDKVVLTYAGEETELK